MSTREQELTAQDIWELFRETDRKFEETRQEFQETREELRQRSLDVDRALERLSRQAEKTERQAEKTERQAANTNKKVGELTDKWGEFVESMVEPAVTRLFAGRDITLEGTSLRSKRRRNGRDMEIDILGVDREHVVVVEVKTTLRVDDVKDHVKRLKEFKTFFPEYREHKVVGAVAGMRLQKGADKYAEREGLYVLAQSGETVRMLNDEAFEARLW